MSLQATEGARGLPLHSLSAKFTLMMIGSYAGTDGACFPSLGRLAEDTLQSVDTVRRRIRELEQLEVLVRLARWASPDGAIVLTKIGEGEKPGGCRQSSDELRLQLQMTAEQVQARVDALGWGKKEAADQEDNEADRVAECNPPPLQNAILPPSTALPPSPSQAAATPGVAQLCNPLNRLSNSSGETTPLPPKGGAVDDWDDFQKDWQEPILHQTLCQQLWSAFKPEEKLLCRKAARGYVAWRKGQRKPPNPINAQKFLREIDAWPQFASHAPAAVERQLPSAAIFEAEGSESWRARCVIAKIVGHEPPKALGLGIERGGKFRYALLTAQLALAQFADDDPEKWAFEPEGSPKCGAWKSFLQCDARLITTAWTKKDVLGKIIDWALRDRGLRIPPTPNGFPPRKDGSFGSTV